MRTSDVCPTCSNYINALCVIYNGSVLPTLNINTLETVESALIKIEQWASQGSPSSFPMYVRWGKQSATQFAEGIEPVKNIEIVSVPNDNIPDFTRIFTGKAELPKITFPSEVWEEIKDKQPTLLLDRYRSKARLGPGKGNVRTAGYRHEPQSVATTNNRLSEVLLTENGSYVDFLFENYFVIQETRVNPINDPTHMVRAKGSSKDRSNTNNSKGGRSQPAGFFNFGFRLRLTDGDNVTESNYLGFFKCLLHTVNNNTDGLLITFRPL